MDKINYVLDEIVVGGLVLETNMADILASLQAAKREALATTTPVATATRSFALSRPYG